MTIKQKSLALYKNKPALIREIDSGAGKISILCGENEARVREKDIVLLHEGPLEAGALSELAALSASLNDVDNSGREVWELVSGESETYTLHELAGFFEGGDNPKNAYIAHILARDGLYFYPISGDVIDENTQIGVRTAAEVEAEIQKRSAKANIEAERASFIGRLKQKKLNLPDDEKFLQDVIAFALGKSASSKTLREAGFPYENTPPEKGGPPPAAVTAHRLLMETGVWDESVNPHPSRFGVSLNDAVGLVPPIKSEGDNPASSSSGLTRGSRVDLAHLAAYAIDDEGSTDPDDAVSLEETEEGVFLYVHVADPASMITPDSPADIDARARGATLYAPEKIVRMLPEEALPLFALGLEEISPALTFKMKISADDAGKIIEKTEIILSKVRVKRLSYREADEKTSENPGLDGLFKIAERNFRRRLALGAVQIDFPEVHIDVKLEPKAENGKKSSADINFYPVQSYRSRDLVRECMLLAGEAAANWALEKRLPFPFISQEAEDVPEKIPDGYAGSYELRRCMRQRVLTAKPGLHQGLGLDIYTQVTSPLRRYTDLLCHQQIHAVLEADSQDKIIPEDELLARLAASERAGSAVQHAERASRAHWTAVYCSKNIGMECEGIVLALRSQNKASHAVVLIPSLGIESLAALPRGKSPALNEHVKVKLLAARIPECETVWEIE